LERELKRKRPFERSDIQQLEIERVRTDDLRIAPGKSRAVSVLARLLASPDTDHQVAVSGFCSLVSRHNYALQLADHCLRKDTDPLAKLRDFSADLAHRAPDQRVRAVIERSLETLVVGRRGSAMSFLETLAFFLNAVCEPTLEICYRQSLG